MTLGAACQTHEDSPVGISVAILSALVRTGGLSLYWPPCPGPQALPLLQGSVGVCPRLWPLVDSKALTPRGLLSLSPSGVSAAVWEQDRPFVPLQCEALASPGRPAPRVEADSCVGRVDVRHLQWLMGKLRFRWRSLMASQQEQCALLGKVAPLRIVRQGAVTLWSRPTVACASRP